MSAYTKQQKSQLVMDIVHAHMKGSDDFHHLMHTASHELTLTERHYVKEIIESFPKHFSDCTELMYTLLSTIVEMKTLDSLNSDSASDIQELETKEYAPWS